MVDTRLLIVNQFEPMASRQVLTADQGTHRFIDCGRTTAHPSIRATQLSLGGPVHLLMSEVAIRAAVPQDLERLADLCFALWPESPRDEHRQELAGILAGRNPSTLPLTHLVAEAPGGRLVGFLEAGLRSHADCCDVAQPVGYIEGWYVEDAWRRRGVGRLLVEAAEAWARGQGCREMASDSLMENALSEQAHTGLGYEVVGRSVLYRKQL